MNFFILYLPVVKDGKTKCLPLCVRSQIRLETETVYRRNERFNSVQRRPRYWSVLRHVPAENNI